MAGNFHEAFQEQKLELPSDRSTGLVFTVAMAVVAWFGRHHGMVLWPALIASAAFLGLAMAAPARLRPLNIAWMKLALLMSRVVSPIVMGVLFLITIVPFGLGMQLLRDPLRKKRAGAEASYWIVRGNDPATPAPDMRNQF
ncbi:MAG: hypothetical protein ACKVP7_20595 [Hyphomicrobiaceae bacterium]